MKTIANYSADAVQNLHLYEYGPTSHQAIQSLRGVIFLQWKYWSVLSVLGQFNFAYGYSLQATNLNVHIGLHKYPDYGLTPAEIASILSV